MAEHQCLMMEDGIYHSEQWFIARDGTWSDAAVAAERYTFGLSVLLQDAGAVTEVYAGNRTVVLAEDGRLDEAYRPQAQPLAMLCDVARGGERWLTLRSISIDDVGGLAEVYAGMSQTALREAGALAEEYSIVRNASTLIADNVRIQERYFSVRTGAFADVGAFAERFSVVRDAWFGDAGRVAEAFTSCANAIVFIREEARASEQYSGTGQPKAMLADAGWFEERYRPQAAGEAPDGHTARRVGPTTGWSANTDTWAMSRYTDCQFNSLAVIDGVLHGAGDDGLYRLDADDDAGKPINAHIRTGKQAVTGEQTATMRMLYAGAVTSGRLQVTVDAAPKGRPVFYTYDFEPRPADDLAPQRAKLGRGLKSRYWQATVGNQAGADFTIDTVSVLDSAGQRRV